VSFRTDRTHGPRQFTSFVSDVRKLQTTSGRSRSSTLPPHVAVI